MTALSKVSASDSDIRGITATNLMVRGPAPGPVLFAPLNPLTNRWAVFMELDTNKD